MTGILQKITSIVSTMTLAAVIAVPLKGQMPFEDRSLLIADDGGLRYYLCSISLWEDDCPGEWFEQLEPEDQVRYVFAWTLDTEHIMSRTKKGNLPLWYASFTDHYGFVADTADDFVIYTGEIGRRWDFDAGHYVATYTETSPDGPLQNFLGIERILEFLDALKDRD